MSYFGMLFTELKFTLILRYFVEALGPQACLETKNCMKQKCQILAWPFRVVQKCQIPTFDLANLNLP